MENEKKKSPGKDTSPNYVVNVSLSIFKPLNNDFYGLSRIDLQSVIL